MTKTLKKISIHFLKKILYQGGYTLQSHPVNFI